MKNTTYTIKETTEPRNKLSAERRAVEQNIKILNSLPNKNRGVIMALSQYNRALDAIDEQIRAIEDRTVPNVIKVHLPNGELDDERFDSCLRQLIDLYNSQPENTKYKFIVG